MASLTATAEPSQRVGPPLLRPLTVLLVVYGVWAVMLAAGLAFVTRYGSNVPSWDEWDMVPTMTGEQPITAEWLWSQHNEHRIPVPRLVMLGLYRVFGRDVRVGMYFNVLATAALALGMIVAARHVRGRTSCTDAFFPLLLLNWGQGLNFIWGWQVEFYLSTVLVGVVLVLIVRAGPRPTLGTALATGACLVLLVGSGAHGLAPVPALACWLVSAAVLRWRSGGPHARRDGLAILGIAGVVFLLVALYLVGYESVPYHPPRRGPRGTLLTAVQFLTMSFGPAVRAVWPFSGLGVASLLLSSAAVAAAAVWSRPAERHRALGLLFFLGAMGALALAVGLGRQGFEPRYITLSVPVMCGVYYVWQLYGPPRVNLPARASLLAITLATLWPNTQAGLAYATDLRSRLAAFERDMEDGVPSYLLIHRHGPYLHHQQEILTDYMPLLRRAGLGSFACLRDDPVFREIPVPLHPSSLRQVEWDGGTARAIGPTPHLVFDLPESRYVCGIRLRYTHSNSEGAAPCVSLFWRDGPEQEFTPDRYRSRSPTGDRANWGPGTWLRLAEPETAMTVWVCDTVGQVRLHPDFKPGVFKVAGLVLLVPADE